MKQVEQYGTLRKESKKSKPWVKSSESKTVLTISFPNLKSFHSNPSSLIRKLIVYKWKKLLYRHVNYFSTSSETR